MADLPKTPDAATVKINRHFTIDIVRDLAKRGAGGAVCYATGFSEAGAEWVELEAQLMEASGGDLTLLADAMGSGLALLPLSENVARCLRDGARADRGRQSVRFPDVRLE